MQMTDAQADYATAVLARLLAREMGVELVNLTIAKVPQDTDKGKSA